jgi:hypothetical protein
MAEMSENILKLRQLTEKLCSNSENEYESVLRRLKKVVSEGKTEIGNSETPQSKIKCYEQMCTTITNILTTVNV